MVFYLGVICNSAHNLQLLQRSSNPMRAITGGHLK